MNSNVRSLIKVGLRNPYFIEIFAYKDSALKDIEPFALESLRA